MKVLYIFIMYICPNFLHYVISYILIAFHPPPPPLLRALMRAYIFHSAVRWGGAGLNIEGCGAVRAPALNDCAVWCGCGPLHCGAVRLRAKLLGPRRALIYMC